MRSLKETVEVYNDALSPYSQQGRMLYVAYWFDQLTRKLLGFRQISQQEWLDDRGKSHFDLIDVRLDSLVEVKGMSNNDQLKLFEDQLEFWLQDVGFPESHGIVFLFSYRNSIGNSRTHKDSKTRRPLGKSVKYEGGLSGFLAQNTNNVYVIDIKLLDAWRNKHGTRRYRRDISNPRDVIVINRNNIVDIARYPRRILSELGFQDQLNSWLPPEAKSIRTRTVSTKIYGRKVRFNLYVLLPNVRKTKLLREIKKNATVEIVR